MSSLTQNRFFRWKWAALTMAAVTGFVLGVLGLALMNAGVIYEDHDTCDGARLPEVDAVVVLAGGRGRIAAAGDIWYRYWEDAREPEKARRIPAFFVSGMGPKSGWATLESQVRRGVAPVLQRETVILETVSTDTVGNAERLLEHAHQHRWKKILLMTSSYHMARAKFIFDQVQERQGTRLGLETLSVWQDPFSKGEWMTDLTGVRVTLTEYFKFLYFRLVW